MKTVEFNVSDKLLFDAKKAGELVNALSKIESNIFIASGNSRVNAKSIIGVISLALKPKDHITVSAIGDDEQQALKVVKDILG